MSNNINTIEEIEKHISRREDFQFTDLLGRFINNNYFRNGYNHFTSGKRDGESFVWEALSSIGQDIGKTLVESVKNYIDKVSNVDTCTVAALASMINNLGFNYELFEKIRFLPTEVRNLIDIFSIDPKFLIMNGGISSDFYDWKYHEELKETGALEKTSEPIGNCMSYFNISSQYKNANVGDIGIEDYRQIPLSSISKDVSNGRMIVDGTYSSGSLKLLKIFDTQDTNDIRYILSDEDGVFADLKKIGKQYFDESDISTDVKYEFLSGLPFNRHKMESLSGTSICLSEIPTLSSNGVVFNREKFMSYVKDTFYNLMYDFLNLDYNDNKDRLSVTYVKDTLGYQYFNQGAEGVTTQNIQTDSEIISLKKKYGIRNFDEIGIVDEIDIGNDSLDNYSGTKLEILKLEQKSRQNTYDGSDRMESRYGYYKRKKVLEYAKFIDQKIFCDYDSTETSRYSIDRNYMASKSTQLEVRHVLSSDNEGNVSIDAFMVEKVSESMCGIVEYIQKLRQILKIQTRKNYMKGTKNLLKYIITQYIRSYSKLNGNISKEIQDRLGEIGTDDVEVVEYED